MRSKWLKNKYTQVGLGVSLTIMLSLSGYFLTPYFEVYRMRQHDFPSEYTWEFEYRDYAQLNNSIYSIKVAYRQYDSTFLNHVSPDLAGIYITRDPARKHDMQPSNFWTDPVNDYAMILNDRMWVVRVMTGREFNESGISQVYGPVSINDTVTYVPHELIAYEADLFTDLIVSALSEAPEVNLSDYGYEKSESGYYSFPEYAVLSVEIQFEDLSEIQITAHQDGFLEFTNTTCTEYGVEISMEGHEFPTCRSGSAVDHRYLEFGENFAAFHHIFGTYMRDHIEGK